MSTTPQVSDSAHRTFVPEVLPLTPLELDLLSEEDRELIQNILVQQVEYIWHPSYDLPDAEQTLFGGPAELAEGSSYFYEPLPVDGAADDEEPSEAGLPPQQEQNLFHRYNLARMRVAGILAAHHQRHLPADQLRQLLAWAHRALMARGQILQANIRLVAGMAKRYRVRGRDFEEMVSEGNLALLRSVDRFDCSRGYRFSSYACSAIIRGIQRMRHKINQHHRRFPFEFDEALEPSRWQELQRGELHDDTADTLREIIAENRAALDEAERIVLSERFCLSDPDRQKGMTLIQLGLLLGMTKERIRQIQKTALRKLRRALERDLRAA